MHELEHFYRKQFNNKSKMMGRILRDFAYGEDVAQEAFVRAWKFYPTYDPEKGTLETWFNAILFNALRDHQRDSRLGPQVPSNEISLEDVLANTDISQLNERREFLEDEIDSVPNKRHQEVIYLFFVLGYNSTEISQIVHKMSQSNVTTIVMRFKERLK